MRLHRAALGTLTAIAAIFPAALVACSDDDVQPIVEQDGGEEASTDAAQPETGPAPDGGPRDAEVVDLPPPKIQCAVTPCVVELATAERSTCALLADGTVRCWGTNDRGQLGRGPIEADVDSAPAPVANLSKVTQLSGGPNGYCATTEDGTVACWGDNEAGQLGPDESATFSDVPRTIAGLPKARAAFMGDGIACAALASESGDIMCWGRNTAGRFPSLLDAGDTVQPPTKIDLGGKQITSIAAGSTAMVALTEDGTLLSWGRRSRPGTQKTNMLGREISLDFGAPGPLPYPEKAGFLAGWSETAAASGGGGAFRWGVLIDLRGSVTPEPVSFATSAKVQHLSIGPSAQFCAVLSDESVRCLGSNVYGQLGTGDFDAVQIIPEKVTGLPDKAPARVVTSAFHACTVLVDGAAYCWGLNSRGQLGTGDFTLHTTPTAVRFTP